VSEGTLKTPIESDVKTAERRAERVPLDRWLRLPPFLKGEQATPRNVLLAACMKQLTQWLAVFYKKNERSPIWR
jgi:hypothetical protein